MSAWDDLLAETGQQQEATPPPQAEPSQQAQPAAGSSWDALLDEANAGEAGDAASRLAKHRWGMLKRAEKTDTYPVMEPSTGASALRALNNTPDRPQTKSIMEHFGQELTPGPSLAGNFAKDAAGLGIGGTDMGQLALRSVGDAATHNLMGEGTASESLFNMALESAKFAMHAPLATVGAIANDLVPQLEPYLRAAGVSRDDFNQMFHNNPVGTILSVWGAGEAARGAAGGGGGQPPPGQGGFAEVEARQAMEDAASAHAEAQEAQRNAPRDTRPVGAVKGTWTYDENGNLIQPEPEPPIVGPPGRGPIAPGASTTPLGNITENVGGPGTPPGPLLYDAAGQPLMSSAERVPVLGETPFRGKVELGPPEVEPPVQTTAFKRRLAEWYKRNQDSLREGRFPTAKEVATKAKSIREELERNDPSTPIGKAELDRRLKAWRERNNAVGRRLRDNPEAGGLNPQIFQDLWDLGTHVARTIHDYTTWAAEMTKHIGKISAEWLAQLWDHIRGTKSQAAPEGADAAIERRTDPEQRATITAEVDELRQAGNDLTTTLDEIARRKAAGEINGATESAMMREAYNKYSEAVLGPKEVYRPTGAELSEADRADLAKLPKKPLTPEEKAALTEALKKASPRGEEAELDAFKNFLKKNPRKGGPSLSMLGGQELYERTVRAAVAVGRLVYRVADNFDDWSARVRFEAAKQNVPITDRQLREAWNSPELSRMRPPETQERVNDKTADAVENGTFDTDASRWAGRDVWDTLRQGAAYALDEAKGADWANTSINFLRDAWNSDLGTAPGFTRLKTYMPHAYDGLVKLVTSKMDSFMRTRNHYNTLLDIMGDSKEIRNTFADLINDDRARGIQQRQQQIQQRMQQIQTEDIPQAQLAYEQTNSVGEAMKAQNRLRQLENEHEELEGLLEDGRVPMMDDSARARALADPRIQGAMKYWTEVMMPEVEGLSTNLGITARFNGPLGLYAKMRWVDPFTDVGHKFRDRELTRPQGGLGNTNAGYDVRPRSPLSSKRARGQGPVNTVPENSLFHIIYNTYERRILANNLEKMRQIIRDNAVGRESELKGRMAPLTTTFGSRTERIVPFRLDRLSGVKEDVYHIPSMLEDSYRQVMGNNRREVLWKAFDKINSAATLQVVIMPAEAIRHGFNVISVMTTIGKGKGFWGTPEAAAAAMSLGTTRIGHAIYKAMNLHGPEFAAQLRDMAEGGALRMRNYEGFDVGEKPWLSQQAEKVAGISHLKDMVFGDPGMKRGLWGMETRLRAALWNVIKEDTPGISNVEAGRLVNRAMGTYVSRMEAPLARALQGVDPFVRAGSALTSTGFRTVIGKDALGRFSANNLLAVYGTYLAAQYYSKMLDDKNEWPMEKADWKPTQIASFDRGGKRITFSMSDVLNPLSRAANFSGARAIVESLLHGDTNPNRLVQSWIRGGLNAIRSRYSPIIRDFNILAFNELPYQLPDGTMMPASSPSMAGADVSPIGERLRAARDTTFPAYSKLAGVASTATGGDEIPTGKEVLPDSKILQTLMSVNDILKLPGVPTLRKPIDYERPVVQYATEAEYHKTVEDVIRRARNVAPDKLADFVSGEVFGNQDSKKGRLGKGSRFTDDMVNIYGKPTPAKIAALKEIWSRLGKTEANAAKGGVLQQLNQAQ